MKTGLNLVCVCGPPPLFTTGRVYYRFSFVFPLSDRLLHFCAPSLRSRGYIASASPLPPPLPQTLIQQQQQQQHRPKGSSSSSSALLYMLFSPSIFIMLLLTSGEEEEEERPRGNSHGF